MRRLIIFSFIAFSSSITFAQHPCNDSLYRQFDFWIGEWEAFNTNGQKAGDSKIELVLDSCIILENWTSTAIIKGLRYAGKSYNTWNATTKRWQQYWVDNTGSIISYFDGHYEKNKMIMQTLAPQSPTDSSKILRMTFYNLGPDKVRQHGESSSNGGKTWKTDFDLEYRRKR